MLQFDFKQPAEQLRHFYYQLKGDPALLGQIRILVLGLVACGVVAYSGNALWLEPQRQQITEQIASRDRLQAVWSPQLEAATVARRGQLSQELEKIRRGNEILALKKHFYDLQWREWNDIERFTATILTLDPMAPVSLEHSFKQLTHLETRSRQGFSVHPVRLAGTASFQDLFDYLVYLENRSEIRAIDDLVVERIPVEGYEKEAKVGFSLTVGRISIDGGAL